MPTDPNKPEGSIDFEPTDLQSARQALDELPAGVGRVPMQAPGYWESRRRQATSTDRALAGSTLDWLMALPPSLRPRVTGERYPRIANRIAESWNVSSERVATLQSFLGSDRAQRQGLPPDVQREIELLLKHYG